ncbi:MAG: substrate-binding domain-containing protein [Treponema sp.]|nr:substrate-binding domain-containing protein [Treponema sp.]
MALKLSVRKQYLAERKNAGKRVTIGFAGIADLRHFISLEYIKGMMKACSDYDINFINMGGAIKYSLFDDINFVSHYTKHFKFMKAPLLDGIVTWAATLSEFMDVKAYTKLFSELQPLPMVDIGHMDIPGASMLKIDATSAMRSMMEHLVNVHHYTKFAFIGTDISEPQRRRLMNFEHELKRYGLPLMENAVVMMNKKMETKFIDEAADTLIANFDLHDKKNIEVIVTASDIIASEVIEQFSRRGIRVPGDVAVTGFNNWYESVTSRSPLTTIDLVYFKRGYAAVELLIDKILSPEQDSETLYFPVDLIVRQSCGCLEKSVAASRAEEEIFDETPDSSDSEDDLRMRLSGKIRQIFPYEGEESISRMLDAFFSDVYDENKEESRMLQWFQNVMQDYRKSRDFDSDHFQNAVSELRKLLLPVLKTEKPVSSFYVENIFHQMRTLVSVFQRYETMAERENPYRINNISGQAINFLSAQTMDQVYETLKNELSELDIPGVILALSDTMSRSFPVPKIEFVYPEPGSELEQLMHKPVSEPNLFPKDFFTKDRRYSVMLEVLHHADLYFGYAFFEMKTINLATYDVLRMLLSNALYTVYRKEGRVKFNSYEIEKTQIQELINPDEDAVNPKTLRMRISVKKITDYLTDHINEMTDIEKMADALMISRSYLSRKCRELTGLSVQQLHEKLKIEQAKNMLALGRFELSEIASTLGFKSQNYFSNVFKKNTGLSPLNWLKKN